MCVFVLVFTHQFISRVARSSFRVHQVSHRIYDQNLPLMQRIPQPWPSSQALSLLLDKAGSSFMFAATLLWLVGEDPMPYKVLQEVLSAGSTGLDLLYKQVLSSASPTPAFHRLTGTFMILQTNQSINSLSLLLNI